MPRLPADSILSRHRPNLLEPIWLALAIACFFVFPHHLSLATSVLVMVLFALSFDLLLGFSGVLSFGHAVFFGLGAYVTGWLSLTGWTEPISAVLLAGLACTLLALLMGPFVLRLTGLPLLMVTMAIGVLFFEAAHKATAITGGDDGLVGIRIAPILGVFEWSLGGKTSYIYALCWLVLIFWLLKRVVSSPLGVALQGIRENASRMRLIGNTVVPHLTLAYAVSACIAGFAGAIFTQANAFVGLGVFALDTSVDVLIMLVLGGAGGLHGALVGAPLYMLLKHFSSQWSPFYWMLVIGLLVISIVMLGRGGVLGITTHAWRSLRAGRPTK